VEKFCQAIVNNGPRAVMACKKIVRDLSHQPITQDLINDTVRRIANIRTGNEAQTLMKAFLEKTK
jgi:methylglutaconyl-CoA hydratase